ncbi:tyrosine-type recombinase/integrase [Diaphorobacter nitroreducens]|uniref:tyrosine-type recombinase/integrase n=1 Tax=Diaphorobacter nitroreducens TaxID=164759 RepID=UPI0028996B64|nr:tyrosine-type recombinase/integrase [Diaphorobacter nitroreducens]
MPKIAKQLSERAVAAIRADGRHAVGGVPGLHLRVKGAARGWVLRIKVGEARRDMGLGSYPAVGLAEARDKARAVHDSLRRGEVPATPAATRQATIAVAAMSFEQCARAFMRDKASEWKNFKHRQQWENTLAQYAFPLIGAMPVAAIDLPHVLACLEPIWRDKTETASRLRGRIETVLDWATVRKYRQGENPARWKGHLDKLLPAPTKVAKTVHHRALPIDAMPSFMGALHKRHGISARALEFVIYTAARSGEVRGASWDEIDLKAGLWTVPADRMKAGREHRVPLSAAAIKLLKKTPRLEGCELIFPGTKGQPLSDMSLAAVLRRMDVDAVPHGFRSTFRDWAGDRSHYPRELIEAALAHTLESKVEAAYRRGDALEKRRELMEAWAQFCAGA